MDGLNFDALTRSLSQTPSRRAALRSTLGGIAIAIAWLADPSRSFARQHHKHKHHHHHKHHHQSPPSSPPPLPPTCSPPCPVCQTCNAAGQCVADPSQNRTTCAGSGAATSICCNGACCPGCCDGSGVCGACRVFVTANPTFLGDLGGLTGADATCLARAAAVGLPGSSITGNYKAWLSDSTNSPSTRFRCTAASCSTLGYRLVDGTTVVATDWDDLATCDVSAPFACLAHAIDHTEGNVAPGPPGNVWTHTDTNGDAGGTGNVHCQNWGSADHGQLGDIGLANQSDTDWTRDNALPCDVPARLYCFQQS